MIKCEWCLKQRFSLTFSPKKADATMKIYSYKVIYLDLLILLLMKLLALFLIIILPVATAAQITYVPDDNLEALIEATYPAANNGAANDDYVLTAGISTVGSLGIDGNSYLVSDYTGLEDFIQLTTLLITNQQTSQIDLSAINNVLSGVPDYLYVTISYNNLLTDLALPQGKIQPNIKYNPLLLNVTFQSNNILDNVTFQHNNSIKNIDASLTSTVDPSSVLTITNNDQLECVNISNGGCTFWLLVSIANNPNLTCVEVDDPNYSNTAWGDPTIYGYSYSTNCSCGALGITVNAQSSEEEIIGIYDLLGRECEFMHNKTLLYLYKDGSVQKVHVVK